MSDALGLEGRIGRGGLRSSRKRGRASVDAAAARWPRSPVLVPCLLAAGYLVLLVARFPRLIAWENADSDFASAFTITDAVSHGHTGQVSMGTQGSWIPLLYGLLTHGLSFHRVLWEVPAALLMLAAAPLIGSTVAQVAGGRAAALAVVLIVAASPTALVTFTRRSSPH